MKEFASDLCQRAGRLLLDFFGPANSVQHKGDISNVITAADVASDRFIIAELKAAFPSHSIISEESGSQQGNSEFTWIVDPLDGTSNFAAGIPWFGVLLALLKDRTPILGVLHVPVSQELYCAEHGKGTFFGDRRLTVTREDKLQDVLWMYGMDASTDIIRSELEIQLLSSLKNSVRNLRATNSLLDACYTADGRVGGFINQQMKIWDIAASQLIIEEAGGRISDLTGCSLNYDLCNPNKTYSVLGCARQLHAQVLALTAELAGPV